MVCFNCGRELKSIGAIGRRDVCPHCNADAHCCRNCKFYDTKAYNECAEPVAERVQEKDRSNFCDYFQPGSPSSGVGKSKSELVNAAEALFRKK